jgi:predicted AAA+ superfamily ATPase
MLSTMDFRREIRRFLSEDRAWNDVTARSFIPRGKRATARPRDTLLENTRQFARGYPANNALLWGARGMGKSSLVKAVHAQVVSEGLALKIAELSREDLPTVPRLLEHLRAAAPHRFILFCDDLSFSHDDQHYKSLKAVLDGGIEGRPHHGIFYATAHPRHRMPRALYFDLVDREAVASTSHVFPARILVDEPLRRSAWSSRPPASVESRSGW